MAEVQRARIASLYGEIAGLFSEIPTQSLIVNTDIIALYNVAVEELALAANSDYSRFMFGIHEMARGYNGYSTSTVRTRIGSLVRKLEVEYGFGSLNSSSNAPVVVTVQQNQVLNINVIPIQQLIDCEADDDLRLELEELRRVVDGDKSHSKAKEILKKILDKSWELFIKVLPYVLERMGEK